MEPWRSMWALTPEMIEDATLLRSAGAMYLRWRWQRFGWSDAVSCGYCGA